MPSFEALVADLAKHEAELDSITKIAGAQPSAELMAAYGRTLTSLSQPAADLDELAEKAAALRVLHPDGELEAELVDVGSIDAFEKSILADVAKLLPAKL